jgi:hypothetical protein
MKLENHHAKNVQQDTATVARKQKNVQSAEEEGSVNNEDKQIVKYASLVITVKK